MEFIRNTAGKTIARVITNGVNNVELVFEDGSSIVLAAAVTAGGGAIINETLKVVDVQPDFVEPQKGFGGPEDAQAALAYLRAEQDRKIDPNHLIKANDGTPYRIIRFDGMERWNGPTGVAIVGAYATAEAVWDFIEAEFRAAETREQRSEVYMLQVELIPAHPTEDKSYYALRGHECNMVPPPQKLLRLFNEPVE